MFLRDVKFLIWSIFVHIFTGRVGGVVLAEVFLSEEAVRG
jgi:hypothetical protein